MGYDVREATPVDIKAIATTMRQADVAEIKASSGATPYLALRTAWLVSRDTTFTGVADGEPVCMFGIKAPGMLNDVASPWMLASENLQFHSREFLRRSRDMVSMLRTTFPLMENYVDARNVAAIRWLHWVGFSLYYAEPYGVAQLPFHRFDTRP